MKYKQAFMIMAHGEFELLQYLINQLDHSLVDIYVHIDKKSRQVPELKTKHSKLNIIPRIKVNWGGYSQVECELRLLDAVISSEVDYCYIHLLSGQDLLIKPIDEILEYFENAGETNFIPIDPEERNQINSQVRIKYYHLLREVNKSTESKIWYRLINRIVMGTQVLLKVDRTKKVSTNIIKGFTWFSIKKDAAEYLLNHKDEIKRIFSWGSCVDEMFVQTIIMNSPYAGTVDPNSKRLVNWGANPSSPEIFTIEDLPQLQESEDFFARKFSMSNRDAVEAVCGMTKP